MTLHAKYLLIAAAALSPLSVPLAQAADECQLNFANNNVDFGTFRQDDIVGSKNSWHQMPSREVNVSVYCPEGQTMALFVQGQAGEKGRFYFGDSSALAVRASQMIVDGKKYNIAKTNDRTRFTPDGQGQESLLLHNNEGIVAVDNQLPVNGKQMSFTLKLTPVMNDRQFSRATDITTMESNLMWELLTQ